MTAEEIKERKIKSTLEIVGLYWPSASIKIIPGDQCKLKTVV